MKKHLTKQSEQSNQAIQTQPLKEFFGVEGNNYQITEQDINKLLKVVGYKGKLLNFYSCKLNNTRIVIMANVLSKKSKQESIYIDISFGSLLWEQVVDAVYEGGKDAVMRILISNPPDNTNSMNFWNNVMFKDTTEGADSKANLLKAEFIEEARMYDEETVISEQLAQVFSEIGVYIHTLRAQGELSNGIPIGFTYFIIIKANMSEPINKKPLPLKQDVIEAEFYLKYYLPEFGYGIPPVEYGYIDGKWVNEYGSETSLYWVIEWTENGLQLRFKSGDDINGANQIQWVLDNMMEEIKLDTDFVSCELITKQGKAHEILLQYDIRPFSEVIKLTPDEQSECGKALNGYESHFGSLIEELYYDHPDIFKSKEENPSK